MNDKDLCKWLRDNSSGIYRPSAEAADRIERLIGWIKQDSAINDTCTNAILNTVCDGCRCRKTNT